RSLRSLIPFGNRKSSKTYPPGRAGRTRLTIESLETRLMPASVFVVPITQPADSTHFYSLSEAVVGAGEAGTVTIEPGAAQDRPGVEVQVIQNFITIQGDPSVPASILPSYSIELLAGNVHLTNLNLGSLALGRSDFLSAFNQVLKCTVQDITSFSPKSTF